MIVASRKGKGVEGVQGAAISLSRYNHDNIRPRSFLAFQGGETRFRDCWAGSVCRRVTCVLDSLKVIASQVLDNLMTFR